jgi:hypothetical protein
MTTDDISRDQLVTLIQGVAQKVGGQKVPRHVFLRETGLSERAVLKAFGSYNALVEAAGLAPARFPIGGERLYADNELLVEVVRVLRLTDSKLTRIYFEQQSSVSPSVCERRFGGWLNTLKSAAPLLDPQEDSRLLERINEYTVPSISARRPSITSQNSAGQIAPQARVPESTRQQERLETIQLEGPNVYGDFINFRGLQHAPVNEQGVVFLFGMICRELGYVVESVRSSFPDCEAKRQIRGKLGKWQRVRVEFEYQSRNFQAHGHDPDLCDVIVCWQDNWPECPVEVLELSSALQRLPVVA